MIGVLLATAFALDLDAVRERAVDAAVAVEVAEARRVAAKSTAWTAVGATLPSVTGFASVSTGQGFTSFGFERPVATQSGIGVRGQWVLLSPRTWAAAEGARQELRGQTALLEWARVDARREATARYAAWWSTSRELEARVTAAEDAGKAAEAVQALVDAEIRPRADGKRSEAEALAATADREAAEWRKTAACAELLALLREDVSGGCDFEPPVWNEPLDGPGTHPALDAAEATLASARANTVGTTTALAPEVAATGTAAWYATSGSSGGFGWNAGAEATMPLFGSGSGYADVAGARAAATVAELGLEDQERSLRVALASADARHTAAKATLDARTAALEAAEEALVLVDERYRTGTATLIEWMDARRGRDTAAIALAQAEAEVGTALAELEAARGVSGT